MSLKTGRQISRTQRQAKNLVALQFSTASNDVAKTGREKTFSRAEPKEASQRYCEPAVYQEKRCKVGPDLEEKHGASGPGSDNQRPLDYPDCVEIIVEMSKFWPVTIFLEAFDEYDQSKARP